MHTSKFFKVIVLSLLFFQLNGAAVPFKMGKPGSTKYRLIQENNIPLAALNDPALQSFISEAIQMSEWLHSGYDGAIKEIKKALDLPNHEYHRVARKYFKSLAVVDLSALPPEERLRAELKQKFGNDCPKRVKEWEGYKTLVERYNAIFTRHNINLIFIPETFAHVCHAHLSDDSKLVGGHIICFECGQSSRNIGAGKGGQILAELQLYEAPGVEWTTVTKPRTTYFNLSRTLEDILEKITKTLVTNNPRFVKRSANKIDIQTEDGEYITILLKKDGKTIDSFYPSMENFRQTKK